MELQFIFVNIWLWITVIIVSLLIVLFVSFSVIRKRREEIDELGKAFDSYAGAYDGCYELDLEKCKDTLESTTAKKEDNLLDPLNEVATIMLEIMPSEASSVLVTDEPDASKGRSLINAYSHRTSTKSLIK